MKKEDEMVFYTSLSISNIFLAVLTIWLEYPYSLSYHATTLTRLESAMTVVRLPSTIPPHFDPIISDDTMGSVVYSRDEEILSWKALFISSLVAFFSRGRDLLGIHRIREPVGHFRLVFLPKLVLLGLLLKRLRF